MLPGTPCVEGSQGADRTSWRVDAFGLAVESDFALPGLDESREAGPLPNLLVRRVSSEQVDGSWPAASALRLSEENFGGGEADRTVDYEPSAGYRLFAREFGLAHVDPSGERVLCVPHDSSPWRWQRFLVGRVLPLASTLQGYEPLHASAVVVDDRAIAIVGPSGSGKTSIALHLALRGAALVTDDVLALERHGESVLAHPGSGVASTRDTEDELVRAAREQGVGRILGWAGKLHVAVGRPDRAVPLAGIYFVRDGNATAEVTPLPAPDPRIVLASMLIREVRTPERLGRQLDVCALMARAVPMFTLDRGRGGPLRAAEALERHTVELAR